MSKHIICDYCGEVIEANSMMASVDFERSLNAEPIHFDFHDAEASANSCASIALQTIQQATGTCPS